MLYFWIALLLGALAKPLEMVVDIVLAPQATQPRTHFAMVSKKQCPVDRQNAGGGHSLNRLSSAASAMVIVCQIVIRLATTCTETDREYSLQKIARSSWMQVHYQPISLSLPSSIEPYVCHSLLKAILSYAIHTQMRAGPYAPHESHTHMVQETMWLQGALFGNIVYSIILMMFPICFKLIY